MSRGPRLGSQTGIYHIMFRGVNHCHIFEEDADYQKFICYLTKIKKEIDFEIYAYCLMSNHVHLLIKENNLYDITKIMQRLLTSYAMWFNKKYEREGSLFSNRYKSKPVEVDGYLLQLIRYIHQNPVKSGIVSLDNMGDYSWSSYNDYIGERTFVDTEFISNMFKDINGNDFKNKFVDFHLILNENSFEIKSGKRNNEQEAYNIAKKIIKEVEPNQISLLGREKRNIYLKELKKAGLSTIEITRLTGISRHIIKNLTK